ncbi:MAG: sirohydrochlorin chelatase, partial [Acidimicrobiales bacterium]
PDHDEVTRLLAAGALRPALVVGVPVGFVGAAESKVRLVAAAATAAVPVITLRGERGGAAVAAAIVNALARRAGAPTDPGIADPGCLFIGHGTRSPAGEDELRRFVDAAASRRAGVETRAGYIEFVEPALDDAVDDLVSTGVRRVVAVPLVLLGAGHMKDDGPAALSRARTRHPGVTFAYARDLGVHPDVLAVVSDRARECAEAEFAALPDALVVVGRGSSDPDANADLAKAARLLSDGRELAVPFGNGAWDEPGGAPSLGLVLPAFVSLARPSVPEALARCAALGARRIAVVPYFLFDGLLVERIRHQVATWEDEHAGLRAVTCAHMGIDARLVDLAWHRFDEARGEGAHMNCDGCVHRAPLPGYEHRAGTAPLR